MADNDHNLTLTRVLDAPVDRVWKAWTDQAEIQKWWGPLGVTNPTCEWDARPGGNIHIVMLAGQELGQFAGQEWPMTGQFKEVMPQTKLVYASNAIMDDKPILETMNTVTFEPQGDKTKLTLAIVVTKTTPEAAGPLSGMEMGWTQSLDKFEKYIEGKEQQA